MVGCERVVLVGCEGVLGTGVTGKNGAASGADEPEMGSWG